VVIISFRSLEKYYNDRPTAQHLLEITEVDNEMSCDATPTSTKKYKLNYKPVNNSEPDPYSTEIPNSSKKREDLNKNEGID
jgi:hypothetical protein